MDIDFHYHFDNLDEQQIDLAPSANKELAIVLRELVTNIIRHANASSVTAVIKQQNGHIVLSVQDNGRGFEKGQHKGFGIQGIEERIRNLKGTVNVQTGGDFSGTLSEIGLPIGILETPHE